MSQREYKQMRVDEAYMVYMSDPVGTYRMLVCDDCGMPVSIGFTEVHDTFHSKIDELIEWAQAVSKVMAPKAPMNYTEPEEEPYDNAFGKEDIAGFKFMAGKINESS